MSKLVSVIIPCFNAEKWLTEAIDSCLNQTYSPIEIIVIDDGSTDGSLDIIKSYGDKIIWESGPNKGGNYARNRGFALSKGEYIQYLDADDYLLPEKLERQVHCLEETGADGVYGDWRHQYHLADDKIVLDKVKVSGEQVDILESLLAAWWVSPACLLFRRTAVENCGGWDENLRAGQDRDFFISVVMSGARVVYQPGCYSIYRRYGNVTVSTASKSRYLESHYLIIQRVEQKLSESGKLSVKYRNALAHSYFELARGYLDINVEHYSKMLDKTLSLSPKFQVKRTKIYNFAQSILGFKIIERCVFIVKYGKGLTRKKMTELFRLPFTA